MTTTNGMRLRSVEPVKIARQLMQDVFMAAGSPSLILRKEQWWEFYAGRWEPRSEKWLRRLLLQLLDDSFYQRGDKQKMFVPTGESIRDVILALESFAAKEYEQLPVWTEGSTKKRDPQELIAFNDVLVPVTGDMGVVPRDQSWFDNTVVPVDWDPEATCPTWEHCLQQWSCGDPQWVELLRRWMGYCLMNHRRYAKWLLMYGQPRAGKGTICRVLRGLLGRGGAYRSVSMRDMAKDFGLGDMELVKLVSITEPGKNGSESEFASILKRIVGQDPQTLERKYQDPDRDVELRAAPMMQSNRIPQMSNEGSSVSTKMLLLPFNWSAETPGADGVVALDPYLDGKLLKELAGIARWAVEGARALEAERDWRMKFPRPDGEKEAVEAFLEENNPFDAFLNDRFNRNQDGYVSTEILWAEWEDWRKKMEVKTHVSRTKIREKLRNESTWALRNFRPKFSGGRGLRGLSQKTEPKDES